MYYVRLEYPKAKVKLSSRGQFFAYLLFELRYAEIFSLSIMQKRNI